MRVSQRCALAGDSWPTRPIGVSPTGSKPMTPSTLRSRARSGLAIQRGRHAHGHDDARAASTQRTLAQRRTFAGAEGKAGAGDLFQVALEQRRHVAEPQREEQHDVVGPLQRRLRRQQRIGQRAVLPVVLAAQQREFEPGHRDALHPMSGGLRGLGVGILQRMTEMVGGGVGVALDQQDLTGGHGR